jgi:hypothetical protein
MRTEVVKSGAMIFGMSATDMLSKVSCRLDDARGSSRASRPAWSRSAPEVPSPGTRPLEPTSPAPQACLPNS